MDEAFRPLHRIIEAMVPRGAELHDEDAGVRAYVHRVAIDSPVELDVVRDDGRELEIGSTPPLYYVDTSLRPSYHRMRFTVELMDEPDGG
jgi:hypothetical protein